MSDRARIEEEAALWVARRDDAGWSEADESALQGWLNAAMAHKAAYWRLEAGWRMADRIRALGNGAMSRARVRRRGFGTPLLAIAAGLVTAVGLSLAILMSLPPQPLQNVVTAIGEQKRFGLADGSRIELNTGSAVRTTVMVENREVWLDKGEAYFEVTHDPDRPFVVHAGIARITVLGTKFAVRRDADRVTVSVVEGRVQVENTTRLNAEEKSVISAGDIVVTEQTSLLLAPYAAERVESNLAWRAGRLHFDEVTLGQAAAEFNRYSKRKLFVSPAVGDIRIGGSFEAGNMGGFVRMLADAYGLTVTENSGDLIISD
ncbi:MAG: FecR domain-containing protein [Hyphomonadaceae bacterium]|nr:FecR domain-containing protein [Hyphomonadaceae bacterium]